MQSKYPYIRLAEEEDYKAIGAIWMQQHIIKWMSFRFQDLNKLEGLTAFKSKFDELRLKSDIYVMIDLIDNQEKIVGVRRIKYLKGNYQHIAEFCSMGIDESQQGRGYGQRFYDAFEKIIADEKPNIKRIQLTQSGGNNRASFLSEKNNYQQEAVFPDWLKREGKNKHNYFVLESFIYKIVDKDLQAQAKLIPSLAYQAKMPSLNQISQHMNLNLKDNKIIVSRDNHAVIEFDYYPDESVIEHIGFLENLVLHSANKEICEQALREALSFLLEQNRVKKVELFTSDTAAISLCQALGFWVRGERIASYYDGIQYHNELGVEFSFIGIQEALALLESFDFIQKNPKIKESLLDCEAIISKMFHTGECDRLGATYLQNIVYQLVRDKLQMEALLSLSQQPWHTILDKVPTELLVPIVKLNNQLQQTISKENLSQQISKFYKANTVQNDLIDHSEDKKRLTNSQ